MAFAAPNTNRRAIPRDSRKGNEVGEVAVVFANAGCRPPVTEGDEMSVLFAKAGLGQPQQLTGAQAAAQAAAQDQAVAQPGGNNEQKTA